MAEPLVEAGPAEMPPSARASLSAQALTLAEDMGRRWRQGEAPLVEEYLVRYPALRERPEAALELVYEEFCLRRRFGKDLPVEDFVARFPHWQAQIEVLLGCHCLLESDRPGPQFPEAGECLGDFRLLAELGRGALGRVFLAAQPSLADRLVVLKVTPLEECHAQMR